MAPTKKTLPARSKGKGKTKKTLSARSKSKGKKCLCREPDCSLATSRGKLWCTLHFHDTEEAAKKRLAELQTDCHTYQARLDQDQCQRCNEAVVGLGTLFCTEHSNDNDDPSSSSPVFKRQFAALAFAARCFQPPVTAMTDATGASPHHQHHRSTINHVAECNYPLNNKGTTIRHCIFPAATPSGLCVFHFVESYEAQLRPPKDRFCDQLFCNEPILPEDEEEGGGKTNVDDKASSSSSSLSHYCQLHKNIRKRIAELGICREGGCNKPVDGDSCACVDHKRLDAERARRAFESNRRERGDLSAIDWSDLSE